jgi:TM2 domain-containing membrane protein YozV
MRPLRSTLSESCGGSEKLRYNIIVAYVLWFISGFGALGLHRFYLGKTGTGFLWLFTGGLGMVGSVYDAVTLSQQVRRANIKAGVQSALEYQALTGRLPDYATVPNSPRPDSPEKTILRTARKNGGFVTPGEAARKALDKLAASGSAEMRVRSSGVVVYCFPEFIREGRDDFAV